ncbi:tetratricopeptide repeat protein [Glycomyces paridis]|uniref:Tetratricopeptide repeat protein n=1 Tax=Glycomyces paridis TaxID=2126555 RepID=A0A4S8NUX9_9ACTN|nr:tetratricopeptide repeat protein [Glycomyces paridis]THV21228.1 tetratricopeptide repeat protein [Glycomyces paridis]
MSDANNPSEIPVQRAAGRVLKAVERTWPGFVSGAVDGRANELIDAGDHAGAAAVLEQGIERYGPGSVSQLLLAWCLHEADRQEEALTWTDRAVAEEPENADALWLRANVLFELERQEEAAATLWRAVELSPDNGQYHMRLASIQSEDADFADTRELVRKAVALAPDDAWVHQTAGRIYDHHLRHRLAQEHFERALALDPGSVGVRDDLAELLQTRGRFSAGVRLARESVAIAAAADPVDPDMIDESEDVYAGTLWRWPWRWYEWALRAPVVLNVADWVLPTPLPGSAVLAGAVVLGFAAAWTRSVAVLPAECRRDLVARGRRARFAGLAARLVLVLAGTAAMLVGEPSGLQHLGVLGVLVVAYAGWVWQARGNWSGGPDGE